MFPSSSGFSPFFQPSFTACTSQNPSSPLQQQADHSSPFLHFPRAFLNENYDFLENEHFPSQQQHQQEVFGTNLSDDSPQAQEITPVDSQPCVTKRTRSVKCKNKKVNSNAEKQHTSQRRTRKKDRHSKIYTAQGFRDRRMRLSLQIARDFFDLQDMLNFDKASRTIEWLINKSKTAIKELKDSLSKKSKQCSSGDGESGGGKNVSSTSESEVVSEIELQPQYEPSFSSPAVKKSKKLKKALVLNPLARCSREKARERARERTREKLKTRSPNLEQLVVCGSQEINCAIRGTVNGEDQGKEPSTYILQRGMDSLGITDRFVGIGDGQNFCVSNGANFEGEYSGFPGIWEMNNGRAQYSLCGIPNIMSSSTGNIHEQNPNAIFLTNSPNHHQEHNLVSSAFMSTLNYQQGNPNPVFIDISKTNTSHQENPRSITMTTARSTDFHSHPFDGNHLTSTRSTATTTTDDVVNKYGSLY